MSHHPDLEALAARYQELHAAATQGHITPEDALATLSGLSVVDGTGAVWKINKDGEFIRSEYAGAPPVTAPANTYVGPETVTSNPEHGAFNVGEQAPADNGWGTPAAAAPAGFGVPPAPGGFAAPATPPGGFGTAPAAPAPVANPFAAHPAGGFGATPAPDSGHIAPSQAPTSPFEQAPGHTPFAAPEHNVAPQPLPERPSQRERPPKVKEPREPGRALELLKKNKFVIIIATLALVFIAQKFLTGSDEGTTIPKAPTATFTADPDTAPSLADGQAPPTANLPVADDVSAVVSALTDGDRDLISKQLATPADAGRVAHAAAFYKGLEGANLELKTGETAPGTTDGTAAQLWTVTGSGTDLLSIQVSWTQRDGKWRLTDIPLPG